MQFIPDLASRSELPDGAGVAVFSLVLAHPLDGHSTAQAWTDLPDGEWHPVDFQLVPAAAAFSLAPRGTARQVTYEARLPYRALPRPAYSFTYRFRDTRDGSVRWLGNANSNGALVRAGPPAPLLLESALGWADLPHVLGARAWHGSLRADVARFGHASDLHTAHGFAITRDSTVFRFRLADATISLADDNGASAAELPALPAPLAVPLVLLALFPTADRPLLLAGQDLQLQPADDPPAGRAFVLHASSPVTLRRDVDATVVRACIAPLSGIDLLETDSTSFLAVYSRASHRLALIPTTAHPGLRTMVRIQGLSRPFQHSAVALQCSASNTALFVRREDPVEVLVPNDGGECILVTAHTAPNGELISVVEPPASPVTPPPSASREPNDRTPVDDRVNPRAVALRRGILSFPALCAVACFLLTTFLRLLPPLAPVRLVLSLSDRFERFLYEHLFGIQTTAPRKITANGKPAAAAEPLPKEVVFSLPRGDKPVVRVMLQMQERERERGRRSADARAALPRFFFGNACAAPRLTTATPSSENKDSEGEAPVTVLELDRPASEGDTLRVVF
ncbi:hypothetical protein AURDEDRAFT_109794 [Auricularia subglabra TFB-10046 SS5]|nr:hypothetical protein AURDEDRAFT_109794 [Auricularia subglabra TFB-10046 SS5]